MNKNPTKTSVYSTRNKQLSIPQLLVVATVRRYTTVYLSGLPSLEGSVFCCGRNLCIPPLHVTLRRVRVPCTGYAGLCWGGLGCRALRLFVFPSVCKAHGTVVNNCRRRGRFKYRIIRPARPASIMGVSSTRINNTNFYFGVIEGGFVEKKLKSFFSTCCALLVDPR